MQIIGLLKAKNPQAAVMQLIQNFPDPTIQNLVKMAQMGDQQGILQFAQTYFGRMGRNFNSEMSEFMNMINKL